MCWYKNYKNLVFLFFLLTIHHKIIYTILYYTIYIYFYFYFLLLAPLKQPNLLQYTSNYLMTIRMIYLNSKVIQQLYFSLLYNQTWNHGICRISQPNNFLQGIKSLEGERLGMCSEEARRRVGGTKWGPVVDTGPTCRTWFIHTIIVRVHPFQTLSLGSVPGIPG